MTDVKSIEHAVASLPPLALAEFRQWFVAFDAAKWDQQMAQDAALGKLAGLAAEARADYRSGPVEEL